MPNPPRCRHAYVGKIRINYILERFFSADDRLCNREVAPVKSMSYPRINSVAEKHANETCAHAYELRGEAGVRRCLLGWMASDSGIRLPDKMYNTYAPGMKGTGRFIEELRSEYGLSSDQLRELQRASDESKSAAHLKDLVSGLLESWSDGPVPSGKNHPLRPIDESLNTMTPRAAYIAPPG